MNVVGKVLVATLAGFVAAASGSPDDPESLSRMVADLKSLHRVTPAPHRMADSTAALCRIAYNTNPHEGDTEPAFCHVYVTQNGKGTMASGKGRYPQGAVLVKSKLASEKSNDPVLFTVMRKREAGYDPRNGDWEYAVLGGRSKRVLAQGRIESCISCHQKAASSDYVTRSYMKFK